MKNILEYLRIERVSHPAESDIEIGMRIESKFAKHISNFVSTIFEGEIVNFSCGNNGIESYVVVTSPSKKMQFTISEDMASYNYIVTDVDDKLLESKKEVIKNVTSFKTNLLEHATGWNATV